MSAIAMPADLLGSPGGEGGAALIQRLHAAGQAAAGDLLGADRL